MIERWQRLFRMREARLGVVEIAARLGRHRPTLYRELRPNHFRDPDASSGRRHGIPDHCPITAQDMARARRACLATLARRDNLRSHVLDRLRAGWSPQQIAGRAQIASRFRWLRLAGADGEAGGRVCHETIHRHVYGPAGRADGLYRCLARARCWREARHGHRPRGHRVPNVHRIEHRPAEVAARGSFGHWEGDLLIFSRVGTGAILAVHCRGAGRAPQPVPDAAGQPSEIATGRFARDRRPVGIGAGTNSGRRNHDGRPIRST